MRYPTDSHIPPHLRVNNTRKEGLPKPLPPRTRRIKTPLELAIINNDLGEVEFITAPQHNDFVKFLEILNNKARELRIPILDGKIFCNSSEAILLFNGLYSSFFDDNKSQGSKRNYHKFALKFHPDKNPQDHYVEGMFKIVSSLYAKSNDPLEHEDLELLIPKVQYHEKPNYDLLKLALESGSDQITQKLLAAAKRDSLELPYDQLLFESLKLKSSPEIVGALAQECIPMYEKLSDEDKHQYRAGSSFINF